MLLNRNFLIFIILIPFMLSRSIFAQEMNGTIYGSILKNGEAYKHRMHLHYGSGMFFGAQPSGANGNYAFKDLKFGEYFAILGPLQELPFRWQTVKFTLNEENPVFNLDKIDPFSVRVIFPVDGASFLPDKVDQNNPLIFRWTPFLGLDETSESKAEYQIEIFSIDKKQHFKSPHQESTVFHFSGLFPDGSRLQMQPYQWRLIIYPKQQIWFGRSYNFDLIPGDLGEIKPHVGKYITLEVPKWYDSTIEKFDLIKFLDVVFQIEYELSGAYPLQRKKGTIIYDPTINWAHSGFWVGLPIHFGKGWFVEGNAPWFGFFHEMGHDFQTGAIKNFSDVIVHQDTGIPIYSGFVEGFATIAYFYADDRLRNQKNNPAINKAAYNAMRKDVNERRASYLNALDHYEQNGALFHQINPDMVDGMLIKICEQHGWEKLTKFFRYFHDKGPISKKIVGNANTEEQRVTIIIAALSSAMNSDLRREFKQWNFPINDQFYDIITKTIEEYSNL